jgi:hypothetical protein
LEAWSEGLQNGLILYDPAKAERVVAPPYRYHYLPERATRPGARKAPIPPPEGLRLPHAPCPFDGEDFVREREVLRLTSAEGVYHVCCNRYPVTPYHFLVVRAVDSVSSVLPQSIHGPEELKDMLFFLQMAGEPYRAYFNSNRGADGSASGSSVNHWHFQLFLYPSKAPSELLSGKREMSRVENGLEVGIAKDWPAHHLVLEGRASQVHDAAAALWQRVRALNELNVAYNIEAVARPEGAFSLFLFPRKPAGPIEVPGTGALSPDFGGWELSGDVVIPTREVLEWIRLHPAEAASLTARRLRETTRPVPAAGGV